MSRKNKSPLLTLLILAVALAIWAFDAYQKSNAKPPATTTKENTVQASTPTTSNPPQPSSRTGPYETYHNCTLTTDKGNDGDSFRVKLPNGRTEIIRLYFVDTPESAFKNYGGGKNNHRRIAQQAADFGNLTPQQAVDIGKQAKTYTLGMLQKSSFTIHTQWESPFNDERYQAFVEVSNGDKKRFLHELLVERGLARIHTKGAPLPDGTSEKKHKNFLYQLQSTAKTKESGAWGL